MQVLQRINRGRLLLHGFNSLDGCLGGRNGRDGRHACQHRSPADRLLIEECVLTAWSIDDELDAITLDKVDDVGAAFLDLEDTFDRQAGLLQCVRGAFGGDDLEAEIDEAPCQVRLQQACRDRSR